MLCVDAKHPIFCHNHQRAQASPLFGDPKSERLTNKDIERLPRFPCNPRIKILTNNLVLIKCLISPHNLAKWSQSHLTKVEQDRCEQMNLYAVRR